MLSRFIYEPGNSKQFIVSIGEAWLGLYTYILSSFICLGVLGETNIKRRCYLMKDARKLLAERVNEL